MQKGTTLMISFGSFVYTGYIAQSVTVSYPDGNVEVLRNADGATVTKIFQDPSLKLDCDLIILGASGTIVPPVDGATVGLIPHSGTITSFMSLGSQAKFSSGATIMSLSLIKETSMTYT
jgi:hypothetical protein